MLLYALTIVVSAFLLFQVQPIIAKIILPWFGGAAAVWTVCLLFFQCVLLLGYLYAHVVVRYLSARVQKFVHIGLLVASVAALPVYPAVWLKPGPGTDPTAGILGLLAITVGLPYFMLATTSPLLQAWYARQYHGQMPYRLYALSNAGSMFALLSYPVLFEPEFGTHLQASIWSTAYAVFILLCGYTAYRAAGAVAGTDGSVHAAQERGVGTDSPVPAASAPGLRQYMLWLLLPACASLLLLAITNHLSQNVAAIPLLWVLPLSLYLLSFILCFEGSGWYRRNPYLQLLAVALGGMAYGITAFEQRYLPVFGLIALFSLGLFLCCMVLHGELVRLKPDPRYLTHFYLMISAGGALGGIFVGLIAPHIFHALYELPLGLVLCAVLVLFALSVDPEAAPWFRGGRIILPALAAAGALYMALYLGQQIRGQARGARVMERNFYGALRVFDTGPATDIRAVRRFMHGTINHGEEYLNAARRRFPTTYFGPASGVGIAILDKQQRGPIRVGVVGLGTGTLAAYGRPGDYFRYYEINPLVPPIAEGQFSFVPGCPAKLDIAMGDARLTLEKEQPENFDVVAVDAFSGDAPPVHLLTEQAMQLYFRHLKPNGILAMDVSNRYVDLRPVLAADAQALGKLARVVESPPDSRNDAFSATWVLVVSSSTGFSLAELVNSAEIEFTRPLRLWTDDYSNLFQTLR